MDLVQVRIPPHLLRPPRLLTSPVVEVLSNGRPRVLAGVRLVLGRERERNGSHASIGDERVRDTRDRDDPAVSLHHVLLPIRAAWYHRASSCSTSAPAVAVAGR